MIFLRDGGGFLLNQSEVITVMQDAITTVLMASLPMVGVGLVIGLIISILQAATQIHEQTLAFVPKIIAIFITLLVFGGMILTNLMEFFNRVFASIQNMV